MPAAGNVVRLDTPLLTPAEAAALLAVKPSWIYEAVRSGAGIGILHDYIARQHEELVRILPQVSIRRAYWTTYHESARDLVRVRSVIDFLQELVDEERQIFL